MKNEDENIYMNSLYSALTKNRGKLDGIIFTHPVSKKPKISDINYENEYIQRYFVKKRNAETSTIYEVGLDQFNTIQKNPFYLCITVLWKIKGKLETTDTQDGKILGVREFNLNSISKAKNRMTGISLLLNNPLEFYRDI